MDTSILPKNTLKKLYQSSRDILGKLTDMCRDQVAKDPKGAAFCWPGQQWLATEFGYNRQTANRAVKLLHEEGLIKKTQRRKKDGHFTSCMYTPGHILYKSEQGFKNWLYARAHGRNDVESFTDPNGGVYYFNMRGRKTWIKHPSRDKLIKFNIEQAEERKRKAIEREERLLKKAHEEAESLREGIHKPAVEQQIGAQQEVDRVAPVGHLVIDQVLLSSAKREKGLKQDISEQVKAMNFIARITKRLGFDTS